MSDRHACLHPCPSCTRHVRSSEATCPFCEAALPGKCVAEEAPPIGRVASRVALTFAAVTAIAACGNSGGAVAVYGPAPVDVPEPDAGARATPTTTDAGK